MATTALDLNPMFSSLATDPVRNFKFLVDIESVNPGGTFPHPNFSLAPLGFTSVSGLSITTQSIPYRQGGYNTTVHQIPGQTEFTPITLQKGVILGQGQAFEWMKMLFSVIQGAGHSDKTYSFRANVDIWVLHHPETFIASDNTKPPFTPVMKFRVYNAWITSISYSDLNAGDNNLVVEQMTLVHEGFDMHLADTPTVAPAAGASGIQPASDFAV
jgi:phage tail-like protein